MKLALCISVFLLSFLGLGFFAEWYDKVTIKQIKKMHCDRLEHVYGSRDYCPR